MRENTLRGRIGRGIYLLLAVIFALCVTIQFYTAGMAVFDNPAHWLQHTSFIHIFGFNLPVCMLLAALVGAMPRQVYWHLFGTFILIFMMYFTANIGISGLGPLHPVLGTGLLILSVWMTISAFRMISATGREETA
ncbi:DUF6220 domain-containing protein [Salinicoccus halitifaciens]|uniref:DUF423 domain-containing protein n=1 Tax=Salinicoccus halitifaciens TaxID=1073415 RepID=A0ABV2EC91_9STAP|nr:DUF6220 domain-containing protein [Salinicoccus halitifaciens]MCD2138800.1 DUF6220 domain-containing protein [Salinicoccus halitifaciens]